MMKTQDKTPGLSEREKDSLVIWEVKTGSRPFHLPFTRITILTIFMNRAGKYLVRGVFDGCLMNPLRLADVIEDTTWTVPARA